MQIKTNYIKKSSLLMCALGAMSMISCTKYETGFISPYFQYPLSEYSFIKGRLSTSDAINPDGSSIPFKTKITHFYDSNGKVVDDLFAKTYPVTIWTAAYDPVNDTTLAQIEAKRTTQNMPAVTINESNGAITANAASVNIPAGTYSVDMDISNTAGIKSFKNIVGFSLSDGPAYEAAPELGSYQLRLFQVGNENVSIILPYQPTVTVQRVADKPNIIVVKMLDQNGVPFKASEIGKRPNTGLNPVPPYLQNLGDYTHSYVPTDTSMNFPFAFAPMPQASLGNGYNMYYRIPTQYFHVNGYPDNMYSLNIRFPIRFYLEGSYIVTIKMPNITHR